MGHIELAAPVSHIWFLRSIPSKIGLVLDLSIQALEKVIYFASFIITHVNEEEKQKIVLALKQEYRGKKKQLEAEQAKRHEGETTKKSTEAIAKEYEKKLAALDEDMAQAEGDLKDLHPLSIVTNRQ